MAGGRDTRLLSILEMVKSSGGSCQVDTILEAFDISMRTLQRDLAKLRMVGAKIEIRDALVVCEDDGGGYHARSSEAAMRQLAILTYLTGGPSTITSIVTYLNDPIRDFSIDERTVRRDVDYLESRGLVEAPGQWSEPGGKTGPSCRGECVDRSGAYRLSSAFMPRFSLTCDELVAVVLALESAPEAVADHATVVSIRDKLLASVAPQTGPAHYVTRRRFTKGRTRRSDPAILRKVDTLELASLEGRVVRIRYRGTGDGASKVRDVEPLGVVYYWFHDAWYLVARCRRADELRHFRVDRIDGMMLTSDRYEYPEDFDLSDYTSEMWGVYAGEPTSVKVLFFDEMNVVDRLHAEVLGRPSARLCQVDDGVWELVDTVMGLSEFRTWLRTFGSSAVVIEPENLRNQLIASAERMKEIYSGPSVMAGAGEAKEDAIHVGGRRTGSPEG
ncbi:MAG: transcriptional regulator [Bacillota bacterium]|jgi:predicted DNA-binding transcriptional regulator YafY|nr:transcriptional regulator [Bacillota bacterium]HOK70411.1 transcriptional regulator [Bacillota bacterium]HQD81118.1 transcriptional regulator [Bacillota bacterium]